MRAGDVVYTRISSSLFGICGDGVDVHSTIVLGLISCNLLLIVDCTLPLEGRRNMTNEKVGTVEYLSEHVVLSSHTDPRSQGEIHFYGGYVVFNGSFSRIDIPAGEFSYAALIKIDLSKGEPRGNHQIRRGDKLE